MKSTTAGSRTPSRRSSRRRSKKSAGSLSGIYYAPDDKAFIVDRLRELLKAGADLLITTGGMSVDPDDVTRFAIRELGAGDITYGSAVLAGGNVSSRVS